MNEDAAQIYSLRQALFDEVYATLGLRGKYWLQHLLKPLMWTAATRFSRIATRFENSLNSSSFTQAIRNFLPGFVTSWEASGCETLPHEGPLLVVSNHPGTFDSLLIAACLTRDDVSFVSKDFQFLRQLPKTSLHMIFSSDNTYQRMGVARACIRQLQKERALIIFPRGTLEPDPEFMDGASEELGSWSRSLELFLRKVPQTRVLVTIVSGTMKKSFVNSPFLRSLKHRREQQRAAEILQVARQLILPFHMRLTPRLTFGKPLTTEELFKEIPFRSGFENIIEHARQLLLHHIQLYGIETAS